MKKSHKKAAWIAGGVAAVGVVAWYASRASGETLKGIGSRRRLGALLPANATRMPQRGGIPFNLLRSEAPVDSPATTQALEQYIEGRPEVIAMLPQEMAFTRWKQNGGVFGANMMGLVNAVTMRQPLFAQLDMTSAHVPRFPWAQAADGLNRMPVNNGEPYETPVSRGIPQQASFSAYQLGQYASIARHTGDEDFELANQQPESPAEFGQTYQMQWGDNGAMRWIPRS